MYVPRLTYRMLFRNGTAQAFTRHAFASPRTSLTSPFCRARMFRTLATSIFIALALLESIWVARRELGGGDLSRRHWDIGVAQHIEDGAAALAAWNHRLFLAPGRIGRIVCGSAVGSNTRIVRSRLMISSRSCRMRFSAATNSPDSSARFARRAEIT